MRTPFQLPLLLSLLASPVAAQVFQGSSTGVFLNPDAPAGAVYDGVGTSALSWGRAQSASTTTSGLTFHGASFRATPGERVPVGSLTFRNGRIQLGTTIEAVDAALSFGITLPSGQTLAQAFTLGIDATTNTSSEEASADSIRLLTPYSAAAIADGGEVYALRLFFGQAGAGAVSEQEQVLLLEDHSTEVPLEGVISRTFEVLPGTPPVTGTMTFEQVTGPGGLVATGEGTGKLTTGTPSGANGAASVFTLTPVQVGAVRTELPFTAGKLHYFNGTSLTSSIATGATLRLTLGLEPGTFDFPLRFINTANTGTARQNADIIEIAAPASGRVVDIGGIPHVARMFFTNPSTGGYTGVGRFAVEEGAEANSDIRVVLTRWLPETRPFALQITRPGPAEVLLSWPSEPGKSYRLQTSTDLLTFVNDGSTINATNTSALVTREIDNPRRFWRVLELP